MINMFSILNVIESYSVLNTNNLSLVTELNETDVVSSQTAPSPEDSSEHQAISKLRVINNACKFFKHINKY